MADLQSFFLSFSAYLGFDSSFPFYDDYNIGMIDIRMKSCRSKHKRIGRLFQTLTDHWASQTFLLHAFNSHPSPTIQLLVECELNFKRINTHEMKKPIPHKMNFKQDCSNMLLHQDQLMITRLQVLIDWSWCYITSQIELRMKWVVTCVDVKFNNQPDVFPKPRCYFPSNMNKSHCKKHLLNCLQLTYSMLQPSCHPNSTSWLNHFWRMVGVTTEASWDFLHVNRKQLRNFLFLQCQIFISPPKKILYIFFFLEIIFEFQKTVKDHKGNEVIHHPELMFCLEIICIENVHKSLASEPPSISQSKSIRTVKKKSSTRHHSASTGSIGPANPNHISLTKPTQLSQTIKICAIHDITASLEEPTKYHLQANPLFFFLGR
ncbi:hypothetical protein VP01_2928g1 [Puccinia sorghi]|uniref:Uncharacterized protein n=1 Tax=Puccinia sorghi TaxID=27349 RepID=A0A0L6V157_9BASI|nr:hypothetical protein VP01_2928g1 [Puccinia sorghi]